MVKAILPLEEGALTVHSHTVYSQWIGADGILPFTPTNPPLSRVYYSREQRRMGEK